MKNFLFILLPVVFLFSCAVQKRKYQKGFYVSSSKLKTQKDKFINGKENKNAKNLEIKPFKITFEENNEEASAGKKISFANLSPNSILILNDDEPCDIITLQNGEEVSAKVLEITNTEVKYKKCNSNDGPLYIVKKTDVFMIKYANGTKELFKQNSTPPDAGPEINKNTQNSKTTQNHNYSGPKKTQPLAILAIVLAVLGLITVGLTCILALLFANMALKKIRQQPDVYSGELLAKIAKIIAFVILAYSLFAALFSFLLI